MNVKQIRENMTEAALSVECNAGTPPHHPAGIKHRLQH
jgi:hypothetical protein